MVEAVVAGEPLSTTPGTVEETGGIGAAGRATSPAEGAEGVVTGADGFGAPVGTTVGRGDEGGACRDPGCGRLATGAAGRGAAGLGAGMALTFGPPADVVGGTEVGLVPGIAGFDCASSAKAIPPAVAEKADAARSRPDVHRMP